MTKLRQCCCIKCIGVLIITKKCTMEVFEYACPDAPKNTYEHAYPNYIFTKMGWIVETQVLI